MKMASISRWTFAYFGAALVSLFAALVLLASGYGVPEATLAAPSTLVVVHIVAVGWLSLLMLGALQQFLPVLVGRGLAGSSLAALALVLIVAGLCLLLSGFVALDGLLPVAADLLPIGGLILLTGFSIVAAMLLGTLLRAETLMLPAGFVAIALLSLLVTVLLGETLASTLSGLIGGNFSVAMITHGVPIHATFGLGGWLTLAAIGVSHELLPMFLMAPHRRGIAAKVAFCAATAVLAMVGGMIAILIANNDGWFLGWALAGAMTVVAVAGYMVDIIQLYRTRKRPHLELHMWAAIWAFATLPIGVLAIGSGVIAGSEGLVAGAVFALAFGWLSGLGLAMLYKIVPFLTWLECFAPSMGREPTPRVQDLVMEKSARPWFIVYHIAVFGAAVALSLGSIVSFRTFCILMAAAVLGIVYQLVRARRLADLPDPWRHRPMPRLLLPAPQRRRSP